MKKKTCGTSAGDDWKYIQARIGHNVNALLRWVSPGKVRNGPYLTVSLLEWLAKHDIHSVQAKTVLWNVDICKHFLYNHNPNEWISDK